MKAPAPSTPPMPDEQIIRVYTSLTIAFCGALALILALVVFVLVPNGSVRTQGMLIGGALGLVSWFGSQWITTDALSRAARHGLRKAGGVGAVGVAALMGAAFAEFPALVGVVLAVADGSDVGPCVIAIPVAIVAIVVNASGPGAIRRHLDRLST